jgi:hypothetical protein
MKAANFYVVSKFFAKVWCPNFDEGVAVCTEKIGDAFFFHNVAKLYRYSLWIANYLSFSGASYQTINV